MPVFGDNAAQAWRCGCANMSCGSISIPGAPQPHACGGWGDKNPSCADHASFVNECQVLSMQDELVYAATVAAMFHALMVLIGIAQPPPISGRCATAPCC